MGDSTIFPFGQISYAVLVKRATESEYAHELVSFFALDFFDYYAFATRVVEARPDLVLLIANLVSFGPHREDGLFRLLAATGPSCRLPELLLLPLHARDLSIPRLLLVGEVLARPGRRGLYESYDGLRVSFGRAVGLDEFNALERTVGERGCELQTSGQLAVFAPRIGRWNPVVRMMRATVELLVKQGTGALVILVPAPSDRLLRLGVLRKGALDDRVAFLREVVEGAGGQFVDLHRLLPDARFRDDVGHYTPWGAQRIAEALLPRLRAAPPQPAETKPGDI